VVKRGGVSGARGEERGRYVLRVCAGFLALCLFPCSSMSAFRVAGRITCMLLLEYNSSRLLCVSDLMPLSVSLVPNEPCSGVKSRE